MFKYQRSATGLPATATVLAAFALASCGAGDGAAAPTADQPVIAAVDAPSAPAADPVPEAPASFVGSWGVDLAQCAIAQELEGAPRIMRTDGFDQHETHCDFDSVEQTGPAQWRVVQRCSVEGDEQVFDESLAIVDGNLELWSGDREDGVWTLVRCPE